MDNTICFFIVYDNLGTVCYHDPLLLDICPLSAQAMLLMYELSIELSQLVGGLHS